MRAVKRDDRTACGRGDRRRRTGRADRRRRAGAQRRRGGPGPRTRSRNRRNPPPQRPSRLRHARSQALHLRPGLCQAAHRVAQDAGAVLETEAMVTGWAGERALQVTSPRGVRTVTADAVVLATGARERPRPARLVPGDRPDGVYTTGQLQNLVHLHHAQVGTPRGDRRRRAGQLVGGADTARSRLRHRRNGQRLSARGGLRGVSAARPAADGRTGATPAAGWSASTARTACAARWSSTSTAVHGRRSTATPWCSPATGFPTTNWPAPADWPWTPRPAGRWWTPRCGPAAPACSRSATCCIRSTPPTSPRWTDATWRPRCSRWLQRPR